MVFQVVMPDDTTKLVTARDPRLQAQAQPQDSGCRPLLSDYNIYQMNHEKNTKK